MSKRSETYTEAIMAVLNNPKMEPESSFVVLKQLYRDLARAERDERYEERQKGQGWS